MPPTAPLVIVLLLAAVSPQQSSSVVTDPRDRRSYPVVDVAGMRWFARNLMFDLKGSSCPEGEAGGCDTSGRLYPWRVAVTACPAGWHLSTEDEWQRLERALGLSPQEIAQERHRGVGLGEALKIGGASGMNIPFAGWREPDGTYREGNGRDRAAALWTATMRGDDEAWHRDLSSARTGIWRSPVQIDYSLSVRCVAN